MLLCWDAESCIPTFFSNRSGLKESGNISGNFDLHNTNVACTVLVSTTHSHGSEKSFSSAKGNPSIDQSKSRKLSISRKRKLITLGMDSFWEMLSSEWLSKECLITNLLYFLSQMPDEREQGLVTNRPGVSSIAGVVGERLILLEVLWRYTWFFDRLSSWKL